MNGVEILSSKTIYETFLPEWCFPVLLILVILFFVSNFILLVNDHNILMWISVVLMVGCWCLGFFGSMDNKTDIKYIEYKVTIDDSVSMNEFLDKYEILDQEGKIYTVKERE